MRRYLSNYPVHPMAMAYAEGRNIYQNATRHLGKNIILKLDFREFFPSIKSIDWETFLKKDQKGNFTQIDVDTMTRILFWGRRNLSPDCLSIGAPSSPILSNILLYDLDVVLSELGSSRGISYTRYADDITVSGASKAEVLAFEVLARRAVGLMHSPRLSFNDEKRGLYDAGQRRMVTGLILTPDGKVSIGRERKRTISAMLHQFSLGKLEIDQLSLLKGLVGFALGTEVSFIDSMRQKYGNELLDRVLKAPIMPRVPLR